MKYIFESFNEYINSQENNIISESLRNDLAQDEFGMDYNQLGRGEKEWVDDEIDNRNLDETHGNQEGLMVFPDTGKDHAALSDFVDENQYFAEWDSDGYWFFHEDKEDYKDLIDELTKKFKEYNISAKIYKSDEITEKRLQYKRKYTENFPAKTMNSNTKVKTNVIRVVGDQCLSTGEIKDIIKEFEGSASWFYTNKNLFKKTSEGYILSKEGKRVLRKIHELDIKKKESEEGTLNESMKNDINAALKDIIKYNKSQKTYETDIEDLAIDIIKNLGFSAKDPNVANVMNHLINSTEYRSGNVPVDPDLIKELYPLLKNMNEDNTQLVKGVIKNYKKITGNNFDPEDMEEKSVGKIERYIKKKGIDVDDFWDEWLKYNTKNESLNEGVMSTIDLIAKESDSFDEFKLKIFKEFKNSFKNSKDTNQWLREIYDEAK